MKNLFLVRTIILTGSLLLQLSTLCFHSRGAAGDVDLSFDPGSGVNGTVNAIAVQPDGKVIIGGQFTTVKGLARTNVARLNADGSGDSTFNPATGAIGNVTLVTSVALQSDGKVLVISRFDYSVCDEWGCYNFSDFVLTRFNANGSLDSTFNPGTGVYGAVYGDDYSLLVVALQPDGKVLIGGHFTAINGTNRNRIARLNANGSLDSTFNPGTGVDGFVRSIALQPDGKVLIGGSFITVNGTNRSGIARLNANGSLDGNFNPGTGIGYSYHGVRSVVVQSDGKVLIGGWFTTVNGTNRNGIARLNANGSLDNSYDPGAMNSQVFSLALQSDGKTLVGGRSLHIVCVDVTNCSGFYTNFLARLNVNGSLDTSFNSATAAYGGYGTPVASQPDGKVLIGGNSIARLNANGSLDSSFDPGTGVSPFSSLVLQPDGKVLLGGPLTFVNGTNRYGNVRLNADGSLDSTFIPSRFYPDIGAGYDYTVITAVAAQSDGKVLVAANSARTECDEWGCGTSYTDSLTRHNANGSWDGFSPNIGPVYSITPQPDGKVLVGGNFDSVNGTNRNRIARLNADGSLDSSFNPGTGAYGSVRSIALQSDGKVLIGGGFFAVNGTNRFGIARLNADGSIDSNFNPGTGVGNYDWLGVRSVVVQSDGKVLIGGDFTTVNGTNRNRIARLNADGSLDSSFNPGAGANGTVRSIALQSDGKVLIGGDFTTVNGVVRPYVARLYGDSVPSLNIARSNALVILSWPTAGLSFQLQESTGLSLPNSWSPVAQPAVTNAGQISVTVPATVGRKFFRLKSP